MGAPADAKWFPKTADHEPCPERGRAGPGRPGPGRVSTLASSASLRGGSTAGRTPRRSGAPRRLPRHRARQPPCGMAGAHPCGGQVSCGWPEERAHGAESPAARHPSRGHHPAPAADEVSGCCRGSPRARLQPWREGATLRRLLCFRVPAHFSVPAWDLHISGAYRSPNFHQES